MAAPLLTLHRRHDDLTRHLLDVVAGTGCSNMINPSMQAAGDVAFLAYRSLGPEGPPFRAHLVVDRPGRERELVDLTAHAAGHGVDVVADPKLVALGKRMFVTFNTGYDPVRNELYLMEVAPRLGPPRRCDYAGRTAVEKNWAFFEVDGHLHAIYGLRPLVVLRHVDGRGGVDGPLRFEADHDPPTRSAGRGELTIGTQAVRWHDELLLVAHEKVRVRGRRGYFGRAVSVTHPPGGRRQIRVSPGRLVHSLGSIVRRPATRHNPNLLFATYFSGLLLDGDDAYLGYGVNDVDLSFARVGVRATWR